jgi:hypothetical protein
MDAIELLEDLEREYDADNPRLSGAERDFCEDMIEKYEKWGDETFISDKQAAWIEKILGKLRS